MHSASHTRYEEPELDWRAGDDGCKDHTARLAPGTGAAPSMSNLPLPKQGDLLAGKYRIIRTLGEGGMGIVYEAFHTRLRQKVAIKVLKPHVLAHPELAARFEREARAAATLESPHVAKVIDVDTSPEGLPYMVIEFLEGNDLGEELTRRGRFPVQEAVAFVMEACVPIAQAHAMGIVHRDLKPSNLFLAKKGSERVLKLLDFGISKILSDDEQKNTSSLTTLGTPHYMSPEHVRSAADVDRRSDIWSLGVILYELLTGTEPYRGDPARVIAAIVSEPVPPPRTRREDIPEELERVIMRALEKDPRKRFPDVRALSVALAPFAPEHELVAVTAGQELPAGRSFFPPKHRDVPSTKPPPAREVDTLGGVAARPRAARWLLPIGSVLVVGTAVVIALAMRGSSRAAPASSAAVVASPAHVDVEPATPAIKPLENGPGPEPEPSPSASAAAAASARAAEKPHEHPATKPASTSHDPSNPLTL